MVSLPISLIISKSQSRSVAIFHTIEKCYFFKTKNSGGSRISGGRVPTPLGGADVRHRRFSAEMYAKTNELGPLEGRQFFHPPCRMTNRSGLINEYECEISVCWTSTKYHLQESVIYF